MAMAGRRGRAGGISVTRLRRWLLAGVVALLLLLAGLIGYTRWKARKLLTDLPRRLGADIKSETNGFTWSQSLKGHTIFTIHAAKAIQRENGKTTLHDVAITLYGAPGSNRTDSISGAEFEYDQPNGIVRAAGVVHLDLAAPTPAVNSVGDVKSALQPAETATAKPAEIADPSKRIRVTTSGLTFLQKQGIASTDQPLQIVYGDMRGSATGATYESSSGTLKLQSAVEMNGTQNQQTVHIHAAAAELDRASQRATLRAAHIATDASRASGDLMVIALAKAGGIESIHADGHASLEGKGGISAQAPTMNAAMSAGGKLHDVLMQGGVQFTNAAGSTGTASRAAVHFDAAGNATAANFDGSVRMHQSVPGTDRSLVADHVVTAMAKDAAGKLQMRDATASGSAMVRTSVTATGKAGVPVTRVTTLRGASLHAVTAVRGGFTYVSEITGAGSTQLVEDDGAGTIRTSSGDDLHATLFAPKPPGKTRGTAPTPESPAGQVQTAMQVGHVVVTQRTPAKGKQPAAETRATAARSQFDGSSGGLILTGSPQVTSPVMQLAADRIVLQQGSGDAEATGAVRGVYLAASTDDKRPAEPVHLLADHATVSGGGASAKLYGAPTKLARMWSTTAQIEAPVIETERATGKLYAHAAGGDSASNTVHLLLPVQSPDGKTSGKAAPGGTLRITGGTLVYTPADTHGPAHADIGGGVRMDSPGTQLTAKSAIATLASSPVAAKSASPLPGGNLQTVTATGDVHLQQPGRTGTGERLVYTAADQRYELTGTAAAPPRIQDSQRGSVTGTTLLVHGADDSIEIAGEPGHRVRTETEVPRPSRGK